MTRSAGPSLTLSEPAEAPFAAGDLLATKYRVERVIGTGGMGVVVAATHIELDERFAIKLLRPELQKDKELVARFSREAKATVRIKSEHSARVIDVGVDASHGPYMVMEYLEGCDLAAALAREGPLPIRHAAEHIIQACEGLAAAHACGVIHRDVKPENLFLTKRPDGVDIVKVLDFGISKVALTGGISPVATQELMGSPVYMSPEQIRSTANVDVRADVWSLGAVLYELITGTCAFDGESVTKVCARVLEQAPPPVVNQRPDVPPGLVAIIDRCLEKDAANRYQNVAELALALLPFAPSRALASAQRAGSILRAVGVAVEGHVATSVSSVPPPAVSTVELGPFPPPDPLPRDLPKDPSPDSRTADTIRRRRVVATSRGGPFVAIVVLAVVLAAGAVYVYDRRVPRASVTAPVARPILPVAEARRTRQVLVVSEPPGATVFSGNEALGQTPLQTSLEVGPIALKLAKDGFVAESINLVVQPNDPEPIRTAVVLRAVELGRPLASTRLPAKGPLPPKSHPLSVNPAAPSAADANKRTVTAPPPPSTTGPSHAPLLDDPQRVRIVE